MVGKLVPGAQRVGDDDEKIRLEKWEIVVPTVPDDDVRFALGFGQDRGIVHSGEHDESEPDRRFVFLAFLDRRPGRVDVGECGESLHPHRLEVAIRHWMPHERDTQSRVQCQYCRALPALASDAKKFKIQKMALSATGSVRLKL